MVVAVTVGGVTTMAMKVSRPTPSANEFVRTPLVDSLPRTVHIYICVRKVLCRSILTQVVLSVVPFVGNNFRWKKLLLQAMPLKMDTFVTGKPHSEICENNINQTQNEQNSLLKF
jgi:hypothetical protein